MSDQDPDLRTYTDEQIHEFGIAVMRLSHDTGISVRDAIKSITEGDSSLASQIGRHLAFLANEAKRVKKEQQAKEEEDRRRWIEEEQARILEMLAEEQRLSDAEAHEQELTAGFIETGHEDDL
jgi:DNA-binding transcriptional MerR regulator